MHQVCHWVCKETLGQIVKEIGLKEPQREETGERNREEDTIKETSSRLVPSLQFNKIVTDPKSRLRSLSHWMQYRSEGPDGLLSFPCSWSEDLPHTFRWPWCRFVCMGCDLPLYTVAPSYNITWKLDQLLDTAKHVGHCSWPLHDLFHRSLC